MMTLKTEKRDTSVKAKKLRRDGFVPGVLCGRDLKESIAFQVSAQEAESFLKKNHKGSQVVLQIGTEKYHAIVKDIDYNSFLKRIMYIDFQQLVAGEKISVTVPVVLLHEELAHGCVDQELEEIHYKATPENLLDKIEIDFGILSARSVRVKDIKELQSDKIDLVTSEDSVIVTVDEEMKPEQTSEEEVTAEAAAAQ